MTSTGFGPDEPGDLDGCAVDATDPAHVTGDEDVDALVMYADCWDDPEAVERRRAELTAWGAALRGDDA
jgi:hypothetical protein